MRIIVPTAITVAIATIVYAALDFGSVSAWAIDLQRSFQKQMAGAVRALKSGDPGAYAALLGAAGAYGFFHALGPGHGKYLIGGLGLGTSISPVRLVGLATASSVAQALWAVILVFGGFFLVEANARQLTDLAENVLAPASYTAIAFIGLFVIWRGISALPKTSVATRHAHNHDHDHHSCSCHSHGPTPEEAAKVKSLRDAMVLVLSIAARPCTGAIFLLVIAWQMELKTAGIAAVLVMGLGTAALTSLVALSSTAARRLASASAEPLFNGLAVALPVLQIFAGALVVLISLSLLGLSY